MNVGKKTINWLYYERLKVNPEWSYMTENGFHWWADKNKQKVEIIGQEVSPAGEVGYWISIQTELLYSLDLGEQEIIAINTILMPFVSMAGPVYDHHTKTLSLASLVRVYDDISHWMNPLISAAAVLQIGEARILGAELAKSLGAKEAISSPSGKDIRPEPDELAGIIENLYIPVGKHPAKWPAEEFRDAVDNYMKQAPAVLANAGNYGFTVEFPYGEESSLCEVRADQPHPLYGNGLFMLQSFPITVKTNLDGAKIAISMNRRELTQSPFGYGFGSYAYKDNMLYFTSFIPNATYSPGLLPNIYFSCAHRAREVSCRFDGTDWIHESAFSVEHSGVARAMNKFKNDN